MVPLNIMCSTVELYQAAEHWALPSHGCGEGAIVVRRWYIRASALQLLKD